MRHHERRDDRARETRGPRWRLTRLERGTRETMWGPPCGVGRRGTGTPIRRSSGGPRRAHTVGASGGVDRRETPTPECALRGVAPARLNERKGAEADAGARRHTREEKEQRVLHLIANRLWAQCPWYYTHVHFTVSTRSPACDRLTHPVTVFTASARWRWRSWEGPRG